MCPAGVVSLIPPIDLLFLRSENTRLEPEASETKGTPAKKAKPAKKATPV
jgi:hypothetical protein